MKYQNKIDTIFFATLLILMIVGTLAQADTNITVTVTTGQENMLKRVVQRMNAERINNLIQQFPNATFTTNATTGNVAARVDGQVVGASGVVTVAGYALDLATSAIQGVSRAEKNAIKAEVAAAYEAATVPTQKSIETTLNVKGE